MSNIHLLLAAMQPDQKLAYYDRCARQVLACYDLGAMTPCFIQHNAGIVFRLDDAARQARYLLKIHESAGDGALDAPEQIEAQLAWLDALAADGRLIVQSPLVNRQGKFITLVQLESAERASACVIQKWITAEHVDHWSTTHAHAVGVLLATMHSISEEWQDRTNDQFGAYHEDFLRDDVQRLAITVELGLISAEQYELIRYSGERVIAMLSRIERTPTTWGIIHGDLHQGNVFFELGRAVAIDFGPYCSYYLYDLGVSLYHATFQDVEIRNALVAGYDSVRPLEAHDHELLEAFMLAATLANLAFQATLVEHRLSPINRRNMLQLAEKFCRPFAAQESFLFDGRSLTVFAQT